MKRALITGITGQDGLFISIGHDRSVRDFAAAAFARVGIRAWEEQARTDPALVRRVDPSLLVGDAGKARHRLRWSSTVSFHEIVARLVDAHLDELRRDA